MKLLSLAARRLTVALFIGSAASVAASAQSPEGLRARYGEPQTRRLKNGLPEVERYLVRPNITATVMYNERGEMRDVLIEPVPGSTPREGRVEYAPDGDYMSTAEVIKVIDEIAPAGQRGKLVRALKVNGGDPAVRLNHFGCTGVYVATYERVAISVSSWCRGGTFDASIRWGRDR